MNKNSPNTQEFLEYISALMEPEAPLWNWRTVLGDQVDFETFQKKYLLPTDCFADSIFCPEPCGAGCRFREISEPYNGQREAVCRERLTSFPVEDRDILINELNSRELFSNAARALNIDIKVLEIPGTEGTSWELGSVPGHLTIPVYAGLCNWEHQMLELIFYLNHRVKGPYILLITHDDLISASAKLMIEDVGANFLPLNKILSFKTNAEFEVIDSFDWPSLLGRSQPEPVLEPENIFRPCGDAWEMRFEGGEKFILTTGYTGASYLHFMLARPNEATPIMEIMRGFSVDTADRFTEWLDENGLADGYALNDTPWNNDENKADDRAIKQYKQEVKDLLHDLNHAIDIGDTTTAKVLREDLELLSNEINKIISPAGQKKKIRDQINKIVTSFRNIVNFSINKIAIHDKALAKHLKECIKYGRTPGYFSSGPIDWFL
jgi:hypothetical protein